MAQTPNKQGSGYINLRDYLNASPTTNLGQSISGAANKDLGLLNGNYNSAQQDFNTQLNKQNIATSDNTQARDTLLNSTDPSKISDTDLSKFQSFLQPQFNAPSTGNLQNQLNTSQSFLQDFTTPGLQSNLLQRYVGQNPNNSNYSLGQKTLDNVFLGQPNSSQSLNDTKQKALQQLSGQQAGLNTANNQIKQAKGANDQFGTDTQTKLNNSIGDYVDSTRGSLTNRLTNYQNQQNQDKQSLITGLQNGTLTQAQANNLGLTQGQSLYNIGQNAADIVGQVYNPANLTLSNVATPQEQARVNALYKLKGETSPIDPTQSSIPQENIESYNKNYLTQLLGNKDADFNKAIAGTQINLNQIMGNNSLAPGGTGNNTMATPSVKGAPDISYYQYENELKPYFTVPNTQMNIGDARTYATNLGNTINNIKSEWQKELATSNPTETKRNNVQNFLNQWQNQLGQLNNGIDSTVNNIGNTQFGANNKLRIQ